MAGSKAEGWATRVDVGPVVVGVRDNQVALVLVTVVVGVADQRALPVVVEVGVGDRHIVRAMGDIEQTIIVVLVVVPVRGQVCVVDPDVVRGLDGDRVTIVGQDLGDLDVADDNVGLLLDPETDAVQRGACGTDDGLVRGDVDLVAASDLSINDDNRCSISRGSRLEILERGDGGLCAICAS